MKPEITMAPSAIEGVEQGHELTVMQFDVTADGKNLYFGAPPEWWNYFIGVLKGRGHEDQRTDELHYWAQAMVDAYNVAVSNQGDEPSDT